MRDIEMLQEDPIIEVKEYKSTLFISVGCSIFFGLLCILLWFLFWPDR